MAPSKKNSSKRVIDFEAALSSSDEEILEIDPKSKQRTRTSNAQQQENDGLSLTDCSETEQVEPKKAAKKRKVDPHTAVLNTATLADVVLASVNPRNKEEKTALISIKGIGIKQIQQLTLRDIAKPRFTAGKNIKEGISSGKSSCTANTYDKTPWFVGNIFGVD